MGDSNVTVNNTPLGAGLVGLVVGVVLGVALEQYLKINIKNKSKVTIIPIQN